MRTSVLSLLSIALAGCMGAADTPTPSDSDPQALSADTSSPANGKGPAASPPKRGDGPGGTVGGGRGDAPKNANAVGCPPPGGAGVPAPPQPPADEACLIAVKQCYADGVEPDTCGSMEKKCGVPPGAPAPCAVVVRREADGGKPEGGVACAPPPAVDEACLIAVKECYADGVEPETCVSMEQECDVPPSGSGSACTVVIQAAASGGKPEVGMECPPPPPCGGVIAGGSGDAPNQMPPGVPVPPDRPTPADAPDSREPS